jgi:cytochrome c oxidase cbb3-type subunit 4
MDINDLRIAVTVISLVLFLVLVARTWSRRRASEYAQAALLPFEGDESMKQTRGEPS